MRQDIKNFVTTGRLFSRFRFSREEQKTKDPKEIVMKKQIYSLFTIAGLMFTVLVTSAPAQAAHSIIAAIPFDFIVMDKVLPAGKYCFEPNSGLGVLKIQSANGQLTVFVLAQMATLRANQAGLKLIFNRFGEQYFLSQVMGFDEEFVHQLSKSRRETVLANNASPLKRNTVSITVHRQ